MTWNYRLIKHDAGTDDECVSIHECFYDDVGNIKMYSANPCGFVSDDVEGLRTLLDKAFAEASQKPVLDAKDLPSA